MRFRIVEFKHPNETYWEVQRRYKILWIFPYWESVGEDGKWTSSVQRTALEAETLYGKLIRKYAKVEKKVLAEYDTSSNRAIEPQEPSTLPDRP